MSNCLMTARIASRCLTGERLFFSAATSAIKVPGSSFTVAFSRRNTLPIRNGARVMASMNITSAVTKKFESMSLPSIAESPVSALEGIGEVRETALNNLKLKTVRDLGEWKYYR